MRSAKIFKNDILCGILTEDEEGYHFVYDETYLVTPGAKPLSPTMPLTREPYENAMMLPVFDGLIPEGWLLDIAVTSWKINRADRMSLLLACCKDCIGDLSVRRMEDE